MASDEDTKSIASQHKIFDVESSHDHDHVAPGAAESVQRHDGEGNEKSTHAALEAAAPPQPPIQSQQMDHGWVCWSQCAASFFMWLNSWGVAQSYGAFQTFYAAEYLPNRRPDDIAWIGSTQTFLLLFVGVLSGPATDAGYARALAIGGHFMVVFGVMMTSLCTKYWQLFLAQGLVVGLGLGLLFTPAAAIIPQYFSKRRGLASSLGSTGSGIGGLIFPIVFRQLQPRIGFAWATRVIGFIALFNSIGTVALVRFRNPPGKIRKLFTMDPLREKAYGTYVAGVFLALLGIYVPYYYIGTYAIVKNITGPDMAFYLLSIANAASILGRIIPALVGDKIGILTVCTICCLSAGLVLLCWLAIHTAAGLIVFAAIVGFLAGAVIGLVALCVMVLTKDLRTFATRFGMGAFASSFAVLIGNPISGALITGHDNFVGLQVFAGVTVLVGGFLVLLSRTFVVGFTMKKI